MVGRSKKKFFKKFRDLNPEIVHELGVSCQEMINLGPKMSEQSGSCDGGPVIISEKSQSWLLAGRSVGGQLSTS